MLQNKQTHRYEHADRPPKLKIKKGHQVEVIAGADRGLRGPVLKVDARRMRILVRGVNMKTHFVKEKGPQKKEAFFHYSNVKRIAGAAPTKPGVSKVKLGASPTPTQNKAKG